jgi:hypothetical protein
MNNRRLNSWDKMLMTRTVLSTFLFFLMAAILLWNLYIFFSPNFLHGYGWSELLINYQGGFVRRGLLGELAFLVHPYISVKTFFISVLGVMYFLFLALFVSIYKFLTIEALTYYFFCPALFSFWIGDTDSFGRKEIYGMVLFLTLISLGLNIKRARMSELRSNIFFTVLNVGILFLSLIHEIIIFFIPFYLIVANQMCFDRNCARKFVWDFITLTSAPLFVFFVQFVFKPLTDPKELIINSWHSLMPSIAPELTKALKFLYMPITEGIRISVEIISTYPTNLHYLFLFFIAILPILCFVIAFYKIILHSIYLDKILVFFCIIVPFILFFVGMDYGRWINQITFYWFFLLVYLVNISRFSTTIPSLVVSDKNNHRLIKWNPLALKASFGFVLFIYLCFGMAEWVKAGSSPILYFPLLRRLKSFFLA